MQRAVCTLCTSFGSWTFFRLFPFKGTAYGAYDCIRKPSESGLSPTACRHWSLFRLPKSKVHTAVHTAFPPCNPLLPPLLETAGGIAPTTRRRGVMESPRIPHIHPFPSASSLSLISGMPLYAVFRPLWRAFAPRGAGWAGIAAIGPHRAAHGIWGSIRAEERRSVAASSHSPWLPPTHKALVTLEKTSRWNRRKGQGTTCPQRICLQAMRR